MTVTLRKVPWGQEFVQVLAAAFAAVDPYRATGDHLHRWLAEDGAGQQGNVLVVGAGKAGLAMARAAVDVLGARISGGLVIVKDQEELPQYAGKIEIAAASHPLPDARGVAATVRLMAMAAAQDYHRLVCLLSGGASALLTAPLLPLTDLQTLTRKLMARGADIVELNTVRKRLETVKGGGLAKIISPKPLLSLILSDVVGDRLDLIASGPTAPNPDPPNAAREVLQKYDLWADLPLNLQNQLTAQGDPGDFSHVTNRLVGNGEAAVRAALAQAERFGYHTRLISTTLTGEAREVGLELAESLRDMPPGSLWAASGETTVTVTGYGQGGRNQELALAVVEALAGLPGIALITFATDGGDGVGPGAGAVVTGDTLARAEALGLHPADFLARNDSHTFFHQLGDSFECGPTGTNVGDLTFLIRLK